MLTRIKNFRRDEKGATAIEFAMVAPVLIWMIFGIIEFGVVMATQSALEGATSAAAREYKALARSNSQGDGPGKIRTKIIDYAGGLVRPGKLRITAKVVTWGNAAGLGGTPSQGQENSSRTGSTGDIIQYRAFYDYSISTPFLAKVMGGNDGIMRLVASTVVQNEPSIGGGGGA